MRSKMWFALLLLFPVTALCQDLVIEDYYSTSGTGAGQYLNTVILADTSSAAFKAGTRVYVLHRNGIYLVNAALTFAGGSTITFKAGSEYTYPGFHYDPIVYLAPTTAGTGAPPGQFINLSGNSTLSMTHIMVSGYREDQLPNDTLLQYSNTMILRTLSTGTNNRIIIDSCVMKTIAGQIIRTEGPAALIQITHSIFADMGHPTSNFGAGKFIDARNVEIDTMIIQNCTLVNLYDRVVRHYQSTFPIENFIFDHNTVVNSMSYHGFLSLGKVDSTGTGTLQITNNLLVDHFALGEDTAAIRQVEFSDPGEKDTVNGTWRMTWVLTNKNNAAVWNIQKNYYASSDSGAAILALGPPNDTIYAGPFYHKQGPPYLTWNMNTLLASQGKDTVHTFIPVTNVKFTNAPGLMTELIRWVLNKSLDDKNKPTLNTSSIWNWTYDFHRHHLEYYFDSLNCSYTSTTDLSMAGTDGQIIGDTRWSFTLIPVLTFSVTPKTVDFDSVMLTLTKSDTVVVSNPSGNTALVVDSVKSSSAEFTVSPASASIPIGGSQKFAITFAPASLGSKSASVVFYDNAPTAMDTVSVSGVGKRLVGVKDQPALPKVFALHDNYPNPFNPSTKIKYDLPKDVKVTLKVYDVLGKEVATLVDSKQAANYYEVEFDGARYASGVYFYRLIAGTFVQTKKMLLLK
ncbi:MAG TPA: choice-of-anchor D domain-containing protein [Candidatus Acidoferrales bacterium]|nr:choice-of-anchor D domain-containing protein [Candidatus Acidoferrales bacterium]